MDKRITNDDIVAEFEGPIPTTLDEIVRDGAKRMLIAALEAEVEAYIQTHKSERDKSGRAMVVRHGKAKERKIQCGAGSMEIQAPRIKDKRPDQKFTSNILPPYLRRSPQLETAVPVLYLRGLSTGDFKPALSVLLGEEAIAGFSASTVTRLLTIWQEEYRGWRKLPLAGKSYVYIWADGLYFKVRLGDDERIACLVVIGALPDGRKEMIAIEDGYRESTEAWKTVLRDLKARGMSAPQLAVADGALGFWNALREVYPQTDWQRCWVHKMINVLDKLPQRLQGRAKAQLREIMQAPTKQEAISEIGRFVAEFEEKYPRATETLTKDRDKLLTYFDYPAAHWVHLRTTNPVESPFATVKQRMKQTRGAGSREAGLAMAFKLLLQAEAKWRRLNAPTSTSVGTNGNDIP
ncbi:MAG: IS256 family transposase [Anaerolineales bacterium]|nr:IS256 family transposase [Anaerolineales bacterium]